jgi:hypothetical protein
MNIDSIINIVKNEFGNGIERIAEELNIGADQIQIRIYTDKNDATPKYTILKNFVPYKSVTFSEFTGNVLFDLKELVVKPFLQKSLRFLSEKEEINLMTVNIIAMKNKLGDIVLWLYNGKIPKKQITVSYIKEAVENSL